MTEDEIFREWLITIGYPEDVDIEKYESLKNTLLYQQYFLKTRFEQLAEPLGEMVKIVVDKMQRVLDSLENYQWFEMQHPRKKPRGSIRRSKRKEREASDD